jgi:hemerythrin superfamily protein
MQQNVTRPPEAATEWPAAIAALKRDHDEVAALFARFERLGPDDAAEATDIARRACAALTVHAALEEELFYPRLRDAAPELIAEAERDHAGAKALIAEVESADEAGPGFRAKVQQLAAYVSCHARDEEIRIFPAAVRSGLDLEALGEEMATRKRALVKAA